MTTAFSYKQGNSILHRCPAWIKILFLPLVSILVFMLPWQLALTLICLQTAAGLFLHLTIREQLYDLQAVLYYAALLIFAKLVGALFTHSLNKDFFTDFIPALLMLLKLFCLMQTASLVFKTSTSLQIRQGLEQIEFAVRRFFSYAAPNPSSPNAGPFYMLHSSSFKKLVSVQKSLDGTWRKKGISYAHSPSSCFIQPWNETGL